VTIDQLREYQDRVVILRLPDSEVLKAKIDFVDLEYEDVVVDVLETNRPAKYTGPTNAVYAVMAAEIASVETIPK
jgi:hypothetical protein